MAIGASVGGLLADRLGRKQVFALTLLVYGLATGASALATGLAMLVVLRFVIGLGLGVELPVAFTLFAEYSPRKIRARMIVILEAFWALGWIMAALIGYYVINTGENGWRWALALGMIPAFYSLVIRLGLPESVTFLESKGRHDEAEKLFVSSKLLRKLVVSRLLSFHRKILLLNLKNGKNPFGRPLLNYVLLLCGLSGSALTSPTMGLSFGFPHF